MVAPGRRSLLICSLFTCLTVAACSDPPSSLPVDNNAIANDADGPVVAKKPEEPTGDPFKVSDKSDLLEFGYSWPGEASGVPEIVTWLKADMDKSKTAAIRDARVGKADAAGSGFPFRPYALETHWKVVGHNGHLLSLVGETYSYTGGAHGMSSYRPLLWDRSRSQIIEPEAIFTSPAAFAKVATPTFCKLLDVERAKKRDGFGGVDDSDPTDPFNACIDPLKQVMVPAGKHGLHAIRVIVAPYEAGPYAEGSYEIDVPMTKAILETIKPEYRSAFTLP